MTKNIIRLVELHKGKHVVSMMVPTNREAENYDTSELVQSTWLLYYSTTNLRWNYFLWCTNLAVIWFKPLMHYKQLQLLPGSQLKWEGGKAVLTIRQK